jgi:DNA-binding transcriptional ArsR family regulator
MFPVFLVFDLYYFHPCLCVIKKWFFSPINNPGNLSGLTNHLPSFKLILNLKIIFNSEVFPMHKLERVQTFDQLKVLADPRRLSILRQLMDSPATLSQLGKTLGEHPAWIRHHLKLLEGAGLVELCQVKVSDGFVEKYYRSKANAYLFQQLLLPEKPGKQTVVLSAATICIGAAFQFNLPT